MIALAALLAGAAAPSWSRELGQARVRFVLAEETYRRRFDDNAAVIGDLEAQAARRISAVLGRRHRFLAFGHEAGPPFEVTFRLDVQSGSSTEPLKEVGFRIGASGPGVSANQAYWTFRPKTEWLRRVGTAEELLTEIELKVAEADHEALEREVLSQIPIAETSMIWPDPWGWVLPYKARELCMDRGSVLMIVNEIPTGAGREPRKLKAEAGFPFDPPGATPFEEQRFNLFARALLDPENERALRQELARIRVGGVYVADYRYLESECAGPLPPGDAFPNR